MTIEHVELGLTDVSGGACACSPNGHGHAHDAADPAPASSGQLTESILVAGMTCSHCVHAVTTELSAIAGVERVDVDLRPDAASAVTIHSAQPLDPADIAAAIDEAGYTLA